MVTQVCKENAVLLDQAEKMVKMARLVPRGHLETPDSLDQSESSANQVFPEEMGTLDPPGDREAEESVDLRAHQALTDRQEFRDHKEREASLALPEIQDSMAHQVPLVLPVKTEKLEKPVRLDPVVNPDSQEQEASQVPQENQGQTDPAVPPASVALLVRQEKLEFRDPQVPVESGVTLETLVLWDSQERVVHLDQEDHVEIWAQGVSQEMTDFPVRWVQRDRKVTRVPRVPKTPPPPHQDPAENQDPPVKSVCPENQDPEGTLVTPGPWGNVEFRETLVLRVCKARREPLDQEVTQALVGSKENKEFQEKMEDQVTRVAKERWERPVHRDPPARPAPPEGPAHRDYQAKADPAEHPECPENRAKGETVEKLALLGPREDKETMARTVVMEPQGRGETPVCRDLKVSLDHLAPRVRGAYLDILDPKEKWAPRENKE